MTCWTGVCWGLWCRIYPRSRIPCLGVRVGRGMKVGVWMHMQTYLLHFQGCLTFETHDAPSLPGACFQGHKEDSGKWHTESFCPTLAPFCLGSGFLLLCPLLPAAPIPPACFPRAAEPARQCALVFSPHPCSANLLDYSHYI